MPLEHRYPELDILAALSLLQMGRSGMPNVAIESMITFLLVLKV
jgi:hypothetical protein